MKITVLIENTSQNNLLSEHGLSLYIEYNDKAYLLDAGSTDKFISNAKALDINLDVDYCILSHGHYDHAGGYAKYLSMYDKQVYAMMSAFDTYVSGDDKHEISIPKTIPKDKFLFIDSVTRLEEDVYLIPHNKLLSDIGKRSKMYRYVHNEYIYDDFSHELSLVFETDKGLVIFNSCSHGGVSHIIEEVKQVLPNKHIYAFIGGLHLKGRKNGKEICTFSSEEMKAMSKYLLDNVDILYTGHCTGSVGYLSLSEFMGNRVEQLYSGKVMEV